MAIFDNVSDEIILFNHTETLATPVTFLPVVNTLEYGKDVSVGFFFRVSGYAADVTVTFQQAEDLAFTVPLPVPANQIVNPAQSLTITAVTPDGTPLPMWGLLGTDQYVRIVYVGGIGTTITSYVKIRSRRKPAVNYANYS